MHSIFEGKERRFEFRLQGRLKTDADQIFFGAEFHEPIEITRILRSSMKIGIPLVKSLNATRGVWFHNCPEHRQLSNDDEERQHFVWPLFAADVLIQTPAGQTPPDLTESFESTPIHERKQVSFNTADTYTLCYWSKYADFLRWSLVNMPSSFMNRPFEDPIKSQPAVLVAYRLLHPTGGHNQQNIRYLARLVFTNTRRSHSSSKTSRSDHSSYQGQAPTLLTHGPKALSNKGATDAFQEQRSESRAKGQRACPKCVSCFSYLLRR